MSLFGATSQPSTGVGFSFGTPSSTATGFGAFGASQVGSTTNKPLFGTTSFGTGFGATTTTAATGTVFGFGAKTTASSTFGFGTAISSTAPSLGGTLTTGFGAAQGLGTSTFGQQRTTGLFSQQRTQSAAPAGQQVAPLTLLTAALSQPQIYGDERDGIIAKLNQLQAYWGTGKGFYNQQGAVDFTPQNPFCRFKVVGYSRLPVASNEDGHLSLEIKKKESEVRAVQQGLVDALHKCLGSKPTLMVCIEGIKPLPDDRSEVVMYVVERHPNGSSRTVPATDVFTHLNQTNIKAQLQTIGIVNILMKTSLSPSQLQQYLDNPPAGIDSLLWEQAKKDNPDPQRLIPTTITGFSELKKRQKLQEQETLQHQKRLALISEEIADLRHNHATTMAKLAQFKRKHLELSHRILEVMIKQECVRKSGYSVQADEEQLRVQLECLQAELNAPSQFKARLNEMMSQIRLRQSQAGERLGRVDGRYVVEGVMQEQLKQHLERQQVGLLHLITIIKDDLQDLGTIERGLTELPSSRT
ncbi:nuclear pore complex protein Nup54-like [Orbicella faveolata]|uniref:nuclear pore complex protein Nup54-like n=1 Tax=Orbicella faveolata TaxID=48498 RepID=UPI0009E4973F|nr:nuclear pore complex protein Nup54-like [Orbicella faveolata]